METYLLSSVIFTTLAVSSIGYMVFNLQKIWKALQVATGPDDTRTDQIQERVLGMLKGGFLQPKMLKDFWPAVMHYLIFFGFLTVSIGTLETILHGIVPVFSFATILGQGTLYQFYLFTQDIGNAMVSVAILWALIRRLFFKPWRLSQLDQHSKNDAYIVLSLIFGLVSTALLYMGFKSWGGGLPQEPLPLSLALAKGVSFPFGPLPSESLLFVGQVFWWIHCLIFFAFSLFIPFSKHQHFIWVWPNMFLRSLHKRGRIRTMEFDENAESFGAKTIKDLSFKQLLDGMTCVECGRCTQECPATNTGKPLDPRLIMKHLKTGFSEYREGKPLRTLGGDIVPVEELWSCTTCGACMEACPLYIEHVPSIIDMRRYLTLTEGSFPEELNQTFKALESSSSPWPMDPSTRGDWAKGLSVTTMAEKNDVDYLFWVGCAGSYDDRYKKVSRSIVKILKEANISFSILGSEEQCNGDTARRLGNEYLAKMQMEANVETIKRYGVKKVVTGCPHCFNTLKNEYPDMGLKLDVIHHSELISELVETKKIAPQKKDDSLTTFHDSCYLGRHNQVYDAPRKTLESSLSKPLTEMPRHKEKGFCCGAGGGRMWLEETMGTRINENRAQEAIATGAKTVASSCPFCMTMLTDGIKKHGQADTVVVKDIAEIVADQLP